MAIQDESYWQREQVGDNLKAFGVRLRKHSGVSADAYGTVGSTGHLVGRHRSLEWNLYSQFATRRNYGTTDPRDRNGNWRLIRAFDLSLPRPVLFEVSRNVENAVRAGRAYMLAEWYGDLGDDNVVDGWFEGRDSTSDNSHKTHFHGGLWTIYADDAKALGDLFNIMIGEGDDMSEKASRIIEALSVGMKSTTAGEIVAPTHWRIADEAWQRKVDATLAADEARDKAVLAAVNALATAGGVEAAPIVAAIEKAKGETIAAVAALQAENEDLRARLAAALAPE